MQPSCDNWFWAWRKCFSGCIFAPTFNDCIKYLLRLTMGTLKAKVRKQYVGFKGRDLYVAHTNPGPKIKMEEMIRLAAEDSGMTESMVAASFYALSKQFEQMLMNGHTLQCGVFGTFRTSFSCKATEERSDMSASNISRRRIIYTASPRVKNALNAAEYVFE